MQLKTDTRLATIIAALASVGAGSIHLAVTPDHWREWAPSGLFFIGIALFQLLWAGLVLRFPRSAWITVGIAASLASMMLWGASRLWGIPMGPNAGVPEELGIPGVLTTLLEAVVVGSAAWSLRPRKRVTVFSTRSYRFALGGAAVFVAALMAPGVVTGLDHEHEGSEHGGAGHEHDSTTTPPNESAPATLTPNAPPSTTSHGSPGHSHGS